MKVTPYRVVKGFKYLKHYGPKAFWARLLDRMEPEEVPYEPWFEYYKASLEELEKQKKQEKKFSYRPVISIVVPTYQTPEHYLVEMLESVYKQSYSNWQLCIADASPSEDVKKAVEAFIQEKQETRIIYQHLEKNLGIAENTNAGLAIATGEWIGLLDHDDLLAPEALFEMVAKMNQDAEFEMLYSDEDKITEEKKGAWKHSQPHFKPDFSIDLLRSNNYITHFLCVKRSILEQAGGFRREFDGAQDYDFILRCTEEAKKVGHVSKVLYHWRVHRSSTSDNPMSKKYAYDAGQRAIEEHLKRMGQQGTVSQRKFFGFYRVKYQVQGNPLISILIPNKDQADVLKRCIQSIEKSSYQNYEVIIIENNSTQPETFQYYSDLCGMKYQPETDSGQCSETEKISCEGKLSGEQSIKVVTWQGGFNYSAINNFGASFAAGEYLILLNNDIELITKDWMEEMLGNCQRPEVGIVGARLYYPDNTIQHAGIVVGIDGIAANMFPGMKREREGYMHRAATQLNYSAVTAACMMIEKKVFDEVGGLEEKLTVAFNDLDLCLRVGAAGYLVVYNPSVEAYHYESKSRGKEDTKEKVRRFGDEIEFIRTRWITLLKKGDPYYNPNFSLKKCNYALKPYK